MSFIVKGSDAGDTKFQDAPPGTYSAVCYRIVDIGTHPETWEGETTQKRKLIMGWELEEKMEDNRPFVIDKWMTISLGKKSTLRPLLASWRGRDFTDEELEGFDLKNVLGKPCMLTVTLTDKGKSKVTAVSKLPKSMTPLEVTNPIQFLSLNDFQKEAFDKLPDWMKKKIQESPEFKKIGKATGFDDMPDDKPWNDPEDCPF